MPPSKTSSPADPALLLDNQLCFALYSTSLAMTKFYKPLLDELGLTYPQYLVMLALWQHAPASVRTLSDLLQLDPGTLSPLLKRLEAIGYLTRRRDPADERSLAVTLTPKGQALREEALKIPPAVVERLGIPLDELQSLHAALTRVIAATA